MNIKKIGVGIIIIFVFISSCIAGFYTIKYYQKGSKTNNITNLNNKNNLKANNGVVPVSAPGSIESNIVISEKTKIIKKYNYNLGIPTTKEIVETAGPDIIGMDRKSAEDYFRKQQFYISDFNDKNITLFKDINTWPPNYYVVKVENEVVNIYYTDNNGKLQFLKRTPYDIGSLPTTDLEELQKGKSFPKLEDIDSMFDELNS
jgi:hypothetical protein